jgi:hypothetical protein
LSLRPKKEVRTRRSFPIYPSATISEKTDFHHPRSFGCPPTPEVVLPSEMKGAIETGQLAAKTNLTSEPGGTDTSLGSIAKAYPREW